MLVLLLGVMPTYLTSIWDLYLETWTGPDIDLNVFDYEYIMSNRTLRHMQFPEFIGTRMDQLFDLGWRPSELEKYRN